MSCEADADVAMPCANRTMTFRGICKYTTCVLCSTAASEVLDLDRTTAVAAGTLDGNIYYAQETPIVVRRLPLQLNLQQI